jgi:hypothetical protein
VPAVAIYAITRRARVPDPKITGFVRFLAQETGRGEIYTERSLIKHQ